MKSINLQTTNPAYCHTRLPRLLIAAGLFLMTLMSSRAAIMLTIELGDISLLPNTSSQSVDLFIRNDGSEDFLAQGAGLKFQIGDGLNSGGGPVITSVDAVTGTPWEGKLLGGQNDFVAEPEFRDVRLLANVFAAQNAVLAAGTETKLATVTFDTTGLFSGTWDFSMVDVKDGVDTKYDFSGGTLFPDVTNGTLNVGISAVPEPEAYGLMAGLGLMVFAIARKRRAVAA